MAEFQPFHGLRYNSERVDLADVLAPPYDVIKGSMRDELMARSPYNVVEVELPAGDDDTKYDSAAKFLRQWKSDGILVRDDVAYYVYEQEFTVPGTGEKRKRRGVLGALTLEEFGQGVQPHAHTLSGPKQDRLKLLCATHTNTSPIFGLFTDTEGWVQAVLESTTGAGHPLYDVQVRDADGIVHRLWRLTDDESVNAIEAAFEDESILIADGHHRYETALNYRNQRIAAAEAAGANWSGAEPDNAVMMICVSLSDPGLIVLPTHRLVKNVEAAALTDLLASLASFFDVEQLQPAGDATALLAAVNTAAEGPARIGLHLPGASYLLTLRPSPEQSAAMEAERSAAYNNLDVSILHRLILQRQLGIDPAALAAGNHVSYTIHAAEAIEKVENGDYAAAFLLRSTPVQQVQDVAQAGDKMPQKSTYFYPKLVTGLVLRPLD